MHLPIKSTLFSCLLLTLNLATASASNSPPTPKPICRLEVQNAHISRTLQKHRQINVVKVNVNSICNLVQTQVLITLEIHKKGLIRDQIYGPFTNDQFPGKNSGLVVSLEDKFVDCSNLKISRWFGIAFSKAIINGKWKYAGRTQSQNIEPLLCGT